MEEINVNIYDAGLQFEVDVQDVGLQINVEVAGAGPVGPQGPAGEPGPQGPKGPAGADGYTPQRGVDYWTAEDVENIVSSAVQRVKESQPQYKLVEKIVVSDAVSQIDRSEDGNGTQYNFDCVFLKIQTEPSETTTELRGRMYFDETVYSYWWFDGGITTAQRYMSIEYFKRFGRFVIERVSPGTLWTNVQQYPKDAMTIQDQSSKRIKKISIYAQSGNIPVGTTIEIWGAV